MPITPTSLFYQHGNHVETERNGIANLVNRIWTLYALEDDDVFAWTNAINLNVTHRTDRAEVARYPRVVPINSMNRLARPRATNAGCARTRRI